MPAWRDNEPILRRADHSSSTDHVAHRFGQNGRFVILILPYSSGFSITLRSMLCELIKFGKLKPVFSYLAALPYLCPYLTAFPSVRSWQRIILVSHFSCFVGRVAHLPMRCWLNLRSAVALGIRPLPHLVQSGCRKQPPASPSPQL